MALIVGVLERMCSNKDSVANQVFNDSSAKSGKDKNGALPRSPVKITKSIVCSPDESPDDSCAVTHDDLVETEIEIHDGNPYFVAETLDNSICVPIAHRTRSSQHHPT